MDAASKQLIVWLHEASFIARLQKRNILRCKMAATVSIVKASRIDESFPFSQNIMSYVRPLFVCTFILHCFFVVATQKPFYRRVQHNLCDINIFCYIFLYYHFAPSTIGFVVLPLTTRTVWTNSTLRCVSVCVCV